MVQILKWSPKRKQGQYTTKPFKPFWVKHGPNPFTVIFRDHPILFLWPGKWRFRYNEGYREVIPNNGGRILRGLFS